MKSPANIPHSFSFKPEKPIKSIEEDKEGLNRNNFSKNLAQNIKNYFKNNTHSITIGLMGEWGCGKTSLLNLTKLHLKDNDIKIMDFNPWMYSSYNQLVEQFFDELISQFSNDSDSDLINDLKSYNFKLNKSNLVKSMLPTIASFGSSKLGDLLNETLKTDTQERSLEKIKDKINEELQNHKIVCIMDDLDRLNSSEINEMFKLIKIMADFDNIIYIIAFDKNVISEALNNNYSEKFIEKIINVPLDVPLISNIELESKLITSLKTLANEHCIRIDEDRLEIFTNPHYIHSETEGIVSFFKNMRDIKRFMNVLEFNIELIKHEVNPIDFFVITAFQLFKPEIYEKIKYNESLLVRETIPPKDYPLNPEIARKEQEEFEKIFKNDSNVKYILQKLFPKMEFIYDTQYSPNDPLYDLEPAYESDLLICHENNFKTYFKLNPILKEISEYEISITIDLINSKKENGVLKQFNNFYEMDKLNLLFKRLNNRLHQINEPEFLLQVIFSIDKKILNKHWRMLEYLSRKLLEQIDSEKRFEILKNGYENINHLDFLDKLTFNLHIQYLDVELTDKEPILTKYEIDNLNEIIIRKYETMIDNYPRYVNENLTDVIKLGRNLELEEDIENIVVEHTKTKEDLLDFLELFISSDPNSFSKKEIQELSDHLNLHIIKDRINENYDEVKNEVLVKKFLKGYELWLDDYIE